MAKIIIIGAGVSGLSAGIYAQMNGHNATIYERHFKAGGNLTGWDRCGYHIDNCIHWLTGTNPVTKLYKTWESLGALGNVEVHQGESLFTFEKDGQSLSLGQALTNLKPICLLFHRAIRRRSRRSSEQSKHFSGSTALQESITRKRVRQRRRYLRSPQSWAITDSARATLPNGFLTPSFRALLSR